MVYDLRPLSFSEILDRSFRVYREHFLTLFAISAVIAIPVEFIWRFVPVVGSMLGALTRAATVPYGMVVMVVYYFDRRCRLEDFDIRLLAEQVRADAPAALETSSSA